MLQENLPSLGQITRYIYSLRLVLVEKGGCYFSGFCGNYGSTTNENYNRRYVGAQVEGLWDLVVKKISEKTSSERTINTANQ